MKGDGEVTFKEFKGCFYIRVKMPLVMTVKNSESSNRRMSFFVDFVKLLTREKEYGN